LRNFIAILPYHPQFSAPLYALQNLSTQHLNRRCQVAKIHFKMFSFSIVKPFWAVYNDLQPTPAKWCQPFICDVSSWWPSSFHHITGTPSRFRVSTG
jgi:hypothetical protein